MSNKLSFLRFLLALFCGISFTTTIYVPASSASQNTAKQAAKKWIAVTSTAMGVTGDITISGNKLTIAHKVFALTFIRELDEQGPDNIFLGVPLTPSSTRLYKTFIAKSSILRNDNTMCGSEDTAWMLARESSDSLDLAFFSGGHEPQLSDDSNLCGTFGYISEQYNDQLQRQYRAPKFEEHPVPTIWSGPPLQWSFGYPRSGASTHLPNYRVSKGLFDC